MSTLIAEASATDKRRGDKLLGAFRGAAIYLLVLLVAVVIVTIVLTRVPLFGYRAVIITGGSMEPAISTGSLLLSHRASPESLEARDIITFRYEGAKTSITHRVVEVHEKDGMRVFTTKGDANPSADAEEIAFVSGRAYEKLLEVPYVGYGLASLGSPLSVWLLLVAPLVTYGILQLVGKREPAHVADAGGYGNDAV